MKPMTHIPSLAHHHAPTRSHPGRPKPVQSARDRNATRRVTRRSDASTSSSRLRANHLPTKRLATKRAIRGAARKTRRRDRLQMRGARQTTDVPMKTHDTEQVPVPAKCLPWKKMRSAINTRLAHKSRPRSALRQLEHHRASTMERAAVARHAKKLDQRILAGRLLDPRSEPLPHPLAKGTAASVRLSTGPRTTIHHHPVALRPPSRRTTLRPPTLRFPEPCRSVPTPSHLLVTTGHRLRHPQPSIARKPCHLSPTPHPGASRDRKSVV